MSSVMATASGPLTGAAGPACASSSTRMPVESTPVPAPSPCKNPRRENALFRFFLESSRGLLIADHPFVSLKNESIKLEPPSTPRPNGKSGAIRQFLLESIEGVKHFCTFFNGDRHVNDVHASGSQLSRVTARQEHRAFVGGGCYRTDYAECALFDIAL